MLLHRTVNDRSTGSEDELLRLLRRLGEVLSAERTSCFQFTENGSLSSCIAEWCKPSAPSLRSQRPVHVTAFPWLNTVLAGSHAVLLESPEALPPDAHSERSAMRSRRTASGIACSVRAHDTVAGFILAESLDPCFHWPTESATAIELTSELAGSLFEWLQCGGLPSRLRDSSRVRDAQLCLALNNANVGIATCALSGRFLSVNQTLCTMLQLSETELLGTTLSEITHPDDRHIPRRKLRDLLRGFTHSLEIERRYIDKSGGVIHTRTRLGTVFDDAHRPSSVVIEIDNITERKKWEEEYLRTCKLESLGVLAGGIAHDFNNILMAILGSASSLRFELGERPLAQDRLLDIERAALRARDLTHQLLTFSKGGSPIKRTASIVEILEDTISFSLSGSNVCSRMEADPALWTVQVDPGQISQVVNNVILNSCQAMPGGGTITVRCRNIVFGRKSPDDLSPRPRRGRYVQISITDEGSGIPAEILQKVFDPFFTTKATGNGLGLATSYSIVRRHRGYIEMESTVGIGTTTHIYLPAAARGAVAARQDTLSIYPGSGRVLVMEDDSTVRSTVGLMLSRLGYDVTFAADGSEAIGRVRESRGRGERFDAAIVDLTIPGGMGGLDATLELHRIDPRLRVIVSSGYTDAPVLSEFRKHGFAGVIAKPYELSTLSSVLHTVLSPAPPSPPAPTPSEQP